MTVSSRSNTTIKQIRALRQRREREASGLCFVEGIRLVGEASQLGATIETLVVAPTLLTSDFAQEIVAAQAREGVRYLEVTADVFASISQKDGPQGIGAVVRQRWQSLAETTLDDGLGWVAFDAVQDPGNLGTVLRTGDGVGTTGVMLLGNSTDPYDPAAVRASMGAVFAQRLVRASFAEFADWKAQHKVFVVGTSDKATQHYRAANYPQPLVLLMGSEQKGLTAEQQALCDSVVHIPMRGRSDSLNLAVATGVLLYEILSYSR